MTDGKTIVLRGEKALKELELSVTTQADHQRIYRVRAAFRALDKEQTRVKLDLDAALEALEPVNNWTSWSGEL